MSEDHTRLHLVQEASARDAALVSNILADGGVSSAIGGVLAAAHYGGGLCPLDIELIINDTDQERAFDILISHGARPSVPEESPAIVWTGSFQRWREAAPSYRFRDRRRVRLCVPMYELPRMGDPVDDALRPFIILYSAETAGLPPLPAVKTSNKVHGSGYTSMSSLVSAYPTSGEAVPLLVPLFRNLVVSEMHILLQHTEYLSPTWGQHVAQLSELLRSGHCEGGYECLPELVNQDLAGFAEWMGTHLRTGADDAGLSHLKKAYESHRASDVTTPTGHHCSLPQVQPPSLA